MFKFELFLFIACLPLISRASQFNTTSSPSQPIFDRAQGIPIIYAQLPKTAGRTSLFTELMGVDEEAFKKNSQLLQQRLTVKENGTYAIKGAHGYEFCAGRIEILNAKALRSQINKKAETNATTRSRGTLNILTHTGVSELQASEKNKHPVIQVASNFNAQETISAYPTTISAYINDPTQGPYAALTAPFGTILRHYYAFYSPSTSPATWAQKDDLDWSEAPDRQITLLSGKGIMIKNGYVKFIPTDAMLQRFESEDNSINNSVCYHHGVQVVLKIKNIHHQQFPLVQDPNKLVDQVYCAALDLGNILRSYRNDTTMTAIAKKVLKNAYEATIYGAITNNRSRVFLTLLGCGVFSNKKEWVCEILAELKPLIKQSGLEVFVVDYSDELAKSNGVQMQSLLKNTVDTIYHGLEALPNEQ